MHDRKEKIREGLEIDYDLIDSDLLRCYIPLVIAWNDQPRPVLAWLEYKDDEGWTEGMDVQVHMMRRTLDDDRELAEGRRMIRLSRYRSYACLAELASRKVEPGEFIIRNPPCFGHTKYVYNLDESQMRNGFADPDSAEHEREDNSFQITNDLSEAQRFTHSEAIRFTIRIMESWGTDIAGDNSWDFYEPLRLDIAEELHARIVRRPRRSETLYAMIRDLDREP